MDDIGYGGTVLLVTGIGVLLYAYVGRARARRFAEAAQHWPTANATITRSWLQAYRYSYTPKVRYTYHLAGQELVGKKLWPGLVGHLRRQPAEEVIGRYPVGAQVPVRYDPENPGRAFLEPTVSGSEYKMLFVTSGIMAVAGAGFLGAGLLHLFPDGGKPLEGDTHHWRHHRSGDEVDMYYDSATVQRRPDGVHVIERTNFTGPQDDGGRFYVSESVYECDRHRVREIHEIAYDSDGRRIGEHDWPDAAFAPDAPGTIGEGIEREVCR